MSKRRLQVLYATFYWLGVLLAAACGSIILVAHTTLLHSSEHMPSALALGGLAIVAFTAGEAFNSVLAKHRDTEDKSKLIRQGSAADPARLTDEFVGAGRRLGSDEDRRRLRPDQIAALAEAIDLLDEVRDRVVSHDIPAAMPLISDTRQRIASLLSGNYRERDRHLSRPAGA
jgi:hypothetical protein